MKKMLLAVLTSLFISTPLLAQKQTFIAVLDLNIDQNMGVISSPTGPLERRLAIFSISPLSTFTSWMAIT